jgi:hypothetical protein
LPKLPVVCNNEPLLKPNELVFERIFAAEVMMSALILEQKRDI